MVLSFLYDTYQAQHPDRLKVKLTPLITRNEINRNVSVECNRIFESIKFSYFFYFFFFGDICSRIFCIIRSAHIQYITNMLQCCIACKSGYYCQPIYNNYSDGSSYYYAVDKPVSSVINNRNKQSMNRIHIYGGIHAWAVTSDIINEANLQKPQCNQPNYESSTSLAMTSNTNC